MNNKIHASIVLIASTMLGACSAENNQKSVPTAKNPAPSAPIQLAESNNGFAFSLLREFFLQEQEKQIADNIFFSPFSISTAFAMVQAGAVGETAESIKLTLQLQDLDDGIIYEGFAGLIQDLNVSLETADQRPYDLTIANRLWLDQSFQVNESYRQITRSVFQAELGLANFLEKPEPARLAINSWVEQQTNNLIQNLFPPDSIAEDTRMVIANAIYFKGQWKSEFDPKLTKALPFRDLSGATILAENVDMMHKLDHFRFAHVAQDQVKVISLPYKGDEISMILVLPDQGSDLNTVQNVLTAEKYQAWLSSLSRSHVSLTMPKFKLETSYDLESYLTALGMGQAFSAGANFSKISTQEELRISAAIHKAFIEVNEEGTEAAAATGIGVGLTSVPPAPQVFQADRPFFYFIMEHDSQNILFAGLMTNPSL